jgi:hypothetical protein
MNGYALKEASIIRNQIEAMKAVHPELTDDLELLADMVEGETDLHPVLAKLTDFVLDAESMAEAVKARKNEMGERQKRYERQGDIGRKAIQQLMEAAGQQKIVLPEATLSITSPRDKAEVTDAEALPQGFYKTERKPLSKEILAALKAGETIPGAQLRVGEAGLMVRTK